MVIYNWFYSVAQSTTVCVNQQAQNVRGPLWTHWLAPQAVVCANSYHGTSGVYVSLDENRRSHQRCYVLPG